MTGDTAGDPCGPKKWIRRSLRWLSQTLSKTVTAISPGTIRRILKQQK